MVRFRDGSDPRPGRGSLRRKKRAQKPYMSRLGNRLRLLPPYIKQNRNAVKSILIFAAFMIVFLLIYSRVTESYIFDEVRNFTARATGFMLNIFGGDVSVDGTMVSSSDFSMGIIAACTGIVPIAIYIAAVVAYPATIRQKLLGIALGVIGIGVINIIRTTILFVLGAHSPSFFDTAHYLIFQSLMIMIAVLLWLFWVLRLNHAVAK